MTYIAGVFWVFMLAALMVIGALALYARRPGRDANTDQWTYPVAFMAGVVVVFSLVGLTATGLAMLVTR